MQILHCLNGKLDCTVLDHTEWYKVFVILFNSSHEPYMLTNADHQLIICCHCPRNLCILRVETRTWVCKRRRWTTFRSGCSSTGRVAVGTERVRRRVLEAVEAVPVPVAALVTSLYPDPQASKHPRAPWPALSCLSARPTPPHPPTWLRPSSSTCPLPTRAPTSTTSPLPHPLPLHRSPLPTSLKSEYHFYNYLF